MIEQRAFSLFHVKAMDEETRTITGMATTPETDRMGDIVDPMGAKFAKDLPLLWQHDMTKPVGRTTFGKASKTGIPFTATISATDEPGTLKDRLDEAWQSVKLGLVQAVSIGFRALEYSFMDNGGVNFQKTEIYELSLVTIPANAGATIQTIKALHGRNDGAAVRLISRAAEKPLDLKGAVALTRR